MLRVTVKLIKAWLNYQRAKIRRRHDEKVSKRSSKKSELYKRSRTTDMFHYFFDKIWREKGHPASRRMNPTKKKRFGGRK